MPRNNKRVRCSQGANATKHRVQRSAKYWREELDYFDEGVLTVKAPNGKSRSFEENKLFILALRATLRRQIEAIEEKSLSPLKLSWTSIEEEVARDFHVGRTYISKVRCTFIEDGDVAVFGLLEERGGAAPGYSHDNQTKIPAHVLISMASYTDEMHSKGAHR
jgi:hypothetical protein